MDMPQSYGIYKKLLFLAGAGLLFGQSPAQAQVLITSSNPSILSTSLGQTVFLTATLQNQSSNTIFFTGDNINFLTAAGPVEFGPPTLTTTVALDDSPFTGSPTPDFPSPLNPNETRTLTLGQFFVGSDATTGSYSGYFTIQGGTDPDSNGDLVTQDFVLNVSASAVPENLSWIPLGLMTGTCIWHLARARRKAEA